MTDYIYTPLRAKASESCNRSDAKKHSYALIFLMPSCSALLLLFVFWQLSQSSVLQILKSIIAGLLLVYYSWEVIYFDSIMPGIMPPSPLSPPSIRTISGHTLHLNSALVVIIGIFFTLFVNWWT